MNGTEIPPFAASARPFSGSTTHFTFATGRALALQPPAVGGGLPVPTTSMVLTGRGPERPAAAGGRRRTRLHHVHSFSRQSGSSADMVAIPLVWSAQKGS